jgi:hypothetical protein
VEAVLVLIRRAKRVLPALPQVALGVNPMGTLIHLSRHLRGAMDPTLSQIGLTPDVIAPVYGY